MVLMNIMQKILWCSKHSNWIDFDNLERKTMKNNWWRIYEMKHRKLDWSVGNIQNMVEGAIATN